MITGSQETRQLWQNNMWDINASALSASIVELADFDGFLRLVSVATGDEITLTHRARPPSK
jgi:hypothetical protein